MSEETELPCEGGPWHGRTYPLSAGMRGVRLASGEEGWESVHGYEWLGWYERVDDRLVWRGPAGMEPKADPADAADLWRPEYANTKAADGGDRCHRCGLGAEPATRYCGACWYIVDQLREATGGVFDAPVSEDR